MAGTDIAGGTTGAIAGKVELLNLPEVPVASGVVKRVPTITEGSVDSLTCGCFLPASLTAEGSGFGAVSCGLVKGGLTGFPSPDPGFGLVPGNDGLFPGSGGGGGLDAALVC